MDIRVASVDDVKDGEMRAVQANGKTLALCRVNGRFYAIDNTCPHRGGPLGEGELEGEVVTCPWHGWRFDVTSGVSPVNPMAKVACYRVSVKGDDVCVEV